MKPQWPDKVFVAGIGTGVGKTLVAAILAEALQADYWKPIQAGTEGGTDRQVVQGLITNTVTKCHAESYLLQLGASPHYAAKAEGVEIDIENCRVPQTGNKLVIEGVGGLLVPVNARQTACNLMQQFNCPIILVVRNYLGSINHTLLSIHYLRSKGIEPLGIIYNGANFNDNEEIIELRTNITVLGRIAETQLVDKTFIPAQAAALRQSISNRFQITAAA